MASNAASIELIYAKADRWKPANRSSYIVWLDLVFFRCRQLEKQIATEDSKENEIQHGLLY
jgi:hypothetical protein